MLLIFFTKLSFDCTKNEVFHQGFLQRMWPKFPAGLVTFTEEILNEKPHFLCSIYCVYDVLLSHFLVVEDHEFSKSTSHILSVPLKSGMRQNSILIYLFFNFNCLPDDALRKTAIWADATALCSSSDKPSDLSQQDSLWVLIWSQWSKLLENISIFHQQVWDIKLFIQA